MKLFKKISALALVALIAIAATACHGKDETAVTVGDVKFTSAYYMCALINSDMEARQKVDDAKAEESEDSSADSSEETDYIKEKIDGKDYTDYVKEQALKTLKQIAAYKLICEKNELTLDEETVSSTVSYAESMWNYGYSTLFEENGVYLSTFKQYMQDSSYSTLYFDYLYGKEGTKAISDDEVLAKITEDYVIAQSLSVSFTTTDSSTGTSTALSEDEITELKAKINAYADEISSGKKTFEQVYHEYNETEEASDNQASDTEGEDEEELKPIYNHASVFGAEDTSYTNDNYETVKAMANGEVKVIELADNAGLLLAVKRDIASDPYYIDLLDSYARHSLKDDELEKEIDEFLKTVEVTVSSYATKQFKVKKIKYPS